MKYEWKKTEKQFYCPKAAPTIIDVPPQNYFVIAGTGDPNCADFKDRIGVLYSLSYTIRMMPKSGYTPPDYQEYTVFPLEGIWAIDDTAEDFAAVDKSRFHYRIMIRQPWFVTPDIVERTFASVRKKHPSDLLEQASFETITDGLSVQMLHVGTYDSEPVTFAKMKEFMAEQGLEQTEKLHREIYLSDPRRTAPEKNRTTIRYFGLKKIK